MYIRPRSCYSAPRALSVHTYTPAYATGLRAFACACLPPCLYGVEHPFFLRATGTLTVQQARPAAPHRPNLRVSVSRPTSVPPPLVPPAHPPTCLCWVGRPWILKPAVFSVLLTSDTLLGDEQLQKESKQRLESSRWERNIRVNFHA